MRRKSSTSGEMGDAPLDISRTSPAAPRSGGAAQLAGGCQAAAPDRLATHTPADNSHAPNLPPNYSTAP